MSDFIPVQVTGTKPLSILKMHQKYEVVINMQPKI